MLHSWDGKWIPMEGSYSEWHFVLMPINSLRLGYLRCYSFLCLSGCKSTKSSPFYFFITIKMYIYCSHDQNLKVCTLLSWSEFHPLINNYTHHKIFLQNKDSQEPQTMEQEFKNSAMTTGMRKIIQIGNEQRN